MRVLPSCYYFNKNFQKFKEQSTPHKREAWGKEVIGPQDPDRKKSTLECDQTLYGDTRQSVVVCNSHYQFSQISLRFLPDKKQSLSFCLSVTLKMLIFVKCLY